MQWVWAGWVFAIIASFAILEGWALHTGRATFSRSVWDLAAAWPPLGVAVGMVIGFLVCHFFWPNQQK